MDREWYLLFSIILVVVLIFVGRFFIEDIEEQFFKFNESVPTDVESAGSIGGPIIIDPTFDMDIGERTSAFFTNFNESYPYSIQSGVKRYNTFKIKLKDDDQILSGDLLTIIDVSFRQWLEEKYKYSRPFNSHNIYFSLLDYPDILDNCWPVVGQGMSEHRNMAGGEIAVTVAYEANINYEYFVVLCG